MLLLACGLFAYNLIYDYSAGQRAMELLDDVMAEFEWDLPPLEDMVYRPPPASSSAAIEGNPPSVTHLPETEHPEQDDARDADSDADENLNSPGASGGRTAQPPSYSVAGILSISKLGIRLPVINECSDELLRISCCVLSGRVDEKPIRLVVVGHNIRSHFGGLDSLDLGDEIAFTNRDGETFYYGATEVKDIRGSDGSDVLEALGWDITLITCKTDRTMRTMVRFAEITSSPP